MRKIIEIISILLAALQVGCFDFKSVSQVEEFRVLGVAAEPPEIRPGEGVRLEVLWADPEGDGRTVSFAWIGCAGLLKAPMGLESCEMLLPPQVAAAEDGGDVLDIPFTPENLLDYAPEGMTFMKATFILLMCAGGELPAADEYESIGAVTDISTLCEGGDGLSAYKTVTISESEDPQRNPEIETLTVDGEELLPADQGGLGTAHCTKADGCGAEIELSLNLTKESFQTFETVKGGETITADERLFVSWFVTDGDVETSSLGSETDDPTGPIENTWTPENPGTHTLYAAAHDSRGGVSWKIYEVEVEPLSE